MDGVLELQKRLTGVVKQKVFGRVLKRTSNSVRIEIATVNANDWWQKITVGGSMIFEWLLMLTRSVGYIYCIKLSKRFPSDKVNYIVTYTHWEAMHHIGTAVMKLDANNYEETLCLGSLESGDVRQVTVEINTDQSSPCAIFHDDTEVTDFILRGEHGSVPFHKAVLVAHSPVFETMLAGEWKETSEGVMDVSGMSGETLHYLKMYMYSGKLPEKPNKPEECFKQLLIFSSRYLMEDLKQRCIKELRFLVTNENVSDMIQFAMENQIKRLLVEIMHCAANREIEVEKGLVIGEIVIDSMTINDIE